MCIRDRYNSVTSSRGDLVAAIVFQTNKDTGITYAYESVSYWDKDKQQSRARRKLIGKVDRETGEIVPTRKSLPSDPESPRKRGPKTTDVCTRSFYGATYLLNAIGDKMGITRDLKTCFPDTYNPILSLAYYMILEEGSPLYRFPKWAYLHHHPYGKEISSQRSSELFQSISEEDKQHFFRRQGKRRCETEYLAYDTTSISSYSNTLRKVKYGRNKEHDPLPQINLALLFGEKSMLPVCYRLLPGNIADVKTIENLVKELDFLDIKKLNLVMDRGFYSEANINELFKNHHKFLIGAKLSLNLVKTHLDKSRGIMVTRSHYSPKFSIYYDTIMTHWNYSELKKRSGEVMKEKRRIYLHLYYNDARAAENREAFNRMLDELEYELVNKKRKPEHEKAYQNYFITHETPIRGISIEAKQDAIDEAEKNFGYFSLLTNGINDPLYALEVYRSKDLVEKALSDHNLFKKFTMQSLLDELDVIEKYDVPGRQSRISELTGKQKELYKCLGVESPT